MKATFTQLRLIFVIMLTAFLGLAVLNYFLQRTSSSSCRSRQLLEFTDIDGNLVKKYIEPPATFYPPGFEEDQRWAPHQKDIVGILNIAPTTSCSRVIEMMGTVFADANNPQEESRFSPSISVLGVNVCGEWLYTSSLPGALCPYLSKTFISTYVDLENTGLAVFRYEPVFPTGARVSTSLKVHIIQDQPIVNIFDFLRERGLMNEWVSFVMGFYDHGGITIDDFFKTYFIKLYGTNEWNKAQSKTIESWTPNALENPAQQPAE